MRILILKKGKTDKNKLIINDTVSDKYKEKSKIIIENIVIRIDNVNIKKLKTSF